MIANTARLLRGHVAVRAQDDPRPCKAECPRRRILRIRIRGVCRQRQRSKAKIQYFDVVLGRELDFGRLQVGMHDAFFVRCFQGFPELPCQSYRLADRNGTLGN